MGTPRVYFCLLLFFFFVFDLMFFVGSSQGTLSGGAFQGTLVLGLGVSMDRA